MLVAQADVIGTGSLALSLPLALAAGVVSFLSPCILPLVPGYLSYVSGSAGAEVQATATAAATAATTATATTTRTRAPTQRGSRTLLGALLFVLGFSAVFTSYGAAFGGVGRALIEHQRGLVQVLGLITVLMGLTFLGAFSRFTLPNRTWRLSYRPSVGVAGAPLLGVLFGIGWTPCIGPTLASVLALSVSSGTAGRGAVLAFAYSLGLGVPFLLLATGLSRAISVLPVLRRHARRFMQVGGVALIVVGSLQVSGLWGQMVARLQGLITGFQPVI